MLSQVLTVAQMRAAEQDLIAAGTSVEALMEKAGHGAGAYVHRISAGRSVAVLCGPGNNGGDGYVIARHLADRGVAVQVFAPLPPGTAAAAAARAAFGGTIHEGIPGDLPHGEVFVDCLFGSGLTRALPDDLHALLVRLAARHHRRVAVDLPSGVESDSGLPLNSALPTYDLTISLGAWKHAHFAMPAAAMMGALRLIDIGCGAVPGVPHVLARPYLRAPAADAHKYRRGLLAIVGGAMPGAALLAARAAAHAGAGYLRLIAGAEPDGIPADLVVVRADPGEALEDGRVAAVLIGPGLGRDEAARVRFASVVRCGLPTVVDADALMILHPAPGVGPGMIFTPHEGELAALERAYGLPGIGHKRERAVALAAASGAVIVAKGADSLIAGPDGRLLLAPRASSWLSVAGSGDVLAGIIASRLAVTRDPWTAAAEGLWLHGEAAARAGAAFSATGLADCVAPALGSLL
ncbi:YjeF-like protein [Novosphingobium nitrogenifigens DSM 19370]|uniref:Bifunctional NAD(P)H-hydrate repair enzyme n=1 Tax=Novosphingobium nitrogenifigens DSM 19370 TaxID=983920 RepID=F1ZA74_9SPHN|nr:YjeF-like protein [Novosphingobium nitrogenifigens DSM 19370]